MPSQLWWEQLEYLMREKRKPFPRSDHDTTTNCRSFCCAPWKNWGLWSLHLNKSVSNPTIFNIIRWRDGSKEWLSHGLMAWERKENRSQGRTTTQQRIVVAFAVHLDRIKGCGVSTLIYQSQIQQSLIWYGGKMGQRNNRPKDSWYEREKKTISPRHNNELS